MGRKTATYIMLGTLAAGVLCAVIGLIVYYTTNANAVQLIVGLFCIALGGTMAGISAVVLLILLIICFVTSKKKVKNNGENNER